MKRIRTHFSHLVLLGCMFLTACNKYLDVPPKGYQLLTTVTDYDQWLNNANDLFVLFPTDLILLGDNVDNPTIPVPPSATSDLIYTWAPQFTAVGTAPEFWGTHYYTINLYNTVIQGIDNATGGTAAQKASLKAEALLGRAFEYWYLVNEYGKEYDPATATTDLAVPFVTSNDIAQTVPPRSTIAKLYDNIIADLNTAIPNLPADNGKARYRGSVAAGYSVLARVYFYRGDYPNAKKYAQQALASATTSAMLDYNTIGDVSGIPSAAQAPDAIYARSEVGGIYETPTLNFLRTFDHNDLRLKFFYSNVDNYTFTVRGNTLYTSNGLYSQGLPNLGTSVQEMKLIIAESAARYDDLTTALQQLNDVRKARIATAAFQPLQSAVQDTVISWSLRERSFELPYTGLRWFDMRRLDKEGKMPAVNRYDAQNNVIATLPLHGNKYTLQIPLEVLQYNPGMPQNPL